MTNSCELFIQINFVGRARSQPVVVFVAVGYKSSGDEKGLNRYFLESEVQSRKNALLRNLDLHLRCQKLGVK